MSTNKEQVQAVLANRAYVYQILHMLLASEPTEEMLTIITGTIPKEAIGLLFDPETPEVTAFETCLEDIERNLAEKGADYLEHVRSEYTRLFIGPEILEAPPWESMYTTQEKTLFHEVTLEVRRFYCKCRYLPSEYPKVADDHIALELDFMYHLAAETLESYSLENDEKMRSLIRNQKDFLSEHLLMWSGEYACALSSANTDSMYPLIAQYMDFFLRADASVLTELSSSMTQ